MCKFASILLLAYGATGCADASLAIVNGGFETGNLSGWTVTSQAGSYAGSNFFVDNLATTPQSGTTTVGAKTGLYYAVSDTAGGPGTHILSQSFVVPSNPASVILSYSLFVNSYGGDVIDSSNDLDFAHDANQYGLVSLLSPGTSLFSTGSGVLQNFYKGTDSAGGNPNAYTNYSYDITSLVVAGGTYTLRFAEVDNLDVLNMGVDSVSVNVLPTTTTPEPSLLSLICIGFSGLGILRFRSGKRA